MLFEDNFWCFLANSGRFCGRWATLWCTIPLLSPSNFTQNHFFKMKWLFADVTRVWSPDRAERDTLRVTLAVHVFGQFRPSLWSGIHFVMLESIHPSICQYIHLFIYLSVHLSICLSLCLSVYLYLSLSLSLSLYIYIYIHICIIHI